MPKKKTEEVVPVCYIHLSEYYRRFYEVKYGGQPVDFPKNHPLWMVLNTQLCQNPMLKMITPHCYSDFAFNFDRDGKVFDINVAAPPAEEKSEFLAVCIPETVSRYGTMVKTSGNWQLTKAGAENFRKQAKVDFWMDCLEFIRECKTRAIAAGEDVTIESAMADFMIHYDIPMEHFENLIKYNQRVRKRMAASIQKKRDKMEEKTKRLFYYT